MKQPTPWVEKPRALCFVAHPTCRPFFAAPCQRWLQTVFASTSFAAENFSAPRFMRDYAQHLGLLRSVSRMPEPDTPRTCSR